MRALEHMLGVVPEHHSKKLAIESMVAATEHIRDCERCRLVYCVAFDVVLELLKTEFPQWEITYPPPFKVFQVCFPELRKCPDWPKGI